ncbi:MAG: hypothetical protein ACK559_23800 [bacterium]
MALVCVPLLQPVAGQLHAFRLQPFDIRLHDLGPGPALCIDLFGPLLRQVRQRLRPLLPFGDRH